jgi:hypothetical protein
MTMFVTKVASQLEPLDLQLTDKNGVAIDLTTASAVVVYIREVITEVALVTAGAMSILPPATAGKVRYEWQVADVAGPGLFFAEVRITWPSGKNQRVPADGYVVLEIQENLG